MEPASLTWQPNQCWRWSLRHEGSEVVGFTPTTYDPSGATDPPSTLVHLMKTFLCWSGCHKRWSRCHLPQPRNKIFWKGGVPPRREWKRNARVNYKNTQGKMSKRTYQINGGKPRDAESRWRTFGRPSGAVARVTVDVIKKRKKKSITVRNSSHRRQCSKKRVTQNIHFISECNFNTKLFFFGGGWGKLTIISY